MPPPNICAMRWWWWQQTIACCARMPNLAPSFCVYGHSRPFLMPSKVLRVRRRRKKKYEKRKIVFCRFHIVSVWPLVFGNWIRKIRIFFWGFVNVMFEKWNVRDCSGRRFWKRQIESSELERKPLFFRFFFASNLFCSFGHRFIVCLHEF